MDTTEGVQEFSCPTCHKDVRYDPNDPMYHAGGVMLRKAGEARPSVVYLTCPDGHVHRYRVEGS